MTLPGSPVEWHGIVGAEKAPRRAWKRTRRAAGTPSACHLSFTQSHYSLRATGQNSLTAAARSLCPAGAPEAPAMKLTDFVKGVPEDVWAVFEPILPPVVYKGVG